MRLFKIKLIVVLISQISHPIMGSKTKKSMEPRVVGGSFADIKNYPHAVFLSVNCNGAWICGASVLTQRLVITAAHCLVDCHKNHKIHAYAGNANLENINVFRTIKRFLVNRRFSMVNVQNDIALAYLDRNMPLGINIKRVIVRNTYPGLVNAHVSGWGITNEKTEAETLKLKSVQAKVQPASVCAKYNRQFNAGMMCAGVVSNSADHPASGDSGSGLVTDDYQLIGLVSYRIDAVQALVIYTNISYFYDWILRKTEVLNCYQ